VLIVVSQRWGLRLISVAREVGKGALFIPFLWSIGCDVENINTEVRAKNPMWGSAPLRLPSP